jgi:proline iminopeptidase
MLKTLLRLSFILIIAIMIILAWKILMPVKYDVPEYQIRKGTSFRTLPTGSKIGYIHIQAIGDKKPYPVIFLQGGPGGPVYDLNIELLTPLAETGYDVYLYDQVGCGSSARLEDIEGYSVERHKRDLEEIVEMIGAEKVILIGQSWGAMLATAFIADNARKVDRVIFTGPGPILPWKRELENIRPPDSLNLTQPVFTNRQGRDKIYTLRAKVVEALAKSFNMKLASDEEMDAFSTVLNHEMGRSTVCNPGDPKVKDKIESGSGYYSMVKTVQSFNKTTDIRSKLTECPIPALIMRGQCDGIQWGYANEYLQLFINHRFVVIPGAGHSIGREQPEVYLKTIRQFLIE